MSMNYHVHNYGVGRAIQSTILVVGAIFIGWIFIVILFAYPWLFLGCSLAAILACVLVLPHILRKQPKKEVCPISGLNPCPWHPDGGPHPVVNP